ncbi:MAG: aa3-type cytochrome c oxidase subunit IV, partial [Frankiaceae bacterium]|nr:aa3-type cytochrome c oxidase subunit IV [Frankiaceae bacterium]
RWKDLLFDPHPLGRHPSRAQEPTWAGFGPGAMVTAIIAIAVLLLLVL